MKNVWTLVLLGSVVTGLSSMQKDVFIPAAYHADQAALDDIVQNEVLRRINKEKIDDGVMEYVRAHHAEFTKEQEREYIQKIKQQAIENKVKKSILSHVRQNPLSNIEKDCGVALGDSGRWQAVIDQINFGVLVFDGHGKLVLAEEKNKNKH